MKDRMTLGFDADVAESAALTIADEQATERIFAACDWESDDKANRRAIDNAMRRLKKKDRTFARAVLRGLRHTKIGMSRQAFFCRLKKICNFLKTPGNKGRNLHPKGRKAGSFS